MSTELEAKSPARHEHQIRRQVTMETGIADGMPPTNAPEPSPNKSAAAMALSLLGQKNTAPPPPPPPPPISSPEKVLSATLSAKRPVPPPPTMPHPHYAAWQQYHYPNQSPYPAKKLKVSHAEVTKHVTPSYHGHGMHPPPYVPSPYASYPPQQGMTPYAPGKTGMPYGQVCILYSVCDCVYD